MKIRLMLIGSMVLLALSATAQEKKKGIAAEGGDPDDRASARVLYWDQDANTAAGQFAIDYGRPVWKPVYEDRAQFDKMTDGKVWRMGSNFWTTLVTDVPLEISGKRVAPGIYYLGLKRSADGANWSLAFIDPVAVRKARIDAFDIRKVAVRFDAPMTEAKSETKADKLTITLSYPKEDIKNVTLRVAWGTLVLTAPVKVSL
ncbi:MAG TPA: DUF2911 domain-containing protein [Terriglobia bacterium]|nr:DUF2911 domain-containing protein [Terriglobia bacterium]